MGMRPIVVDTGAEKEALAKKCGAEAFIDFKKEDDVPAKVREVAGGVGAHGVMVTAWQTYKGMAHSSITYHKPRMSSHVDRLGRLHRWPYW